MKLSEWRKSKNLSVKEASTMVGVTDVAFGRYERGRVPDPARLQKIIEITSGAVTANDFFEMPAPSKSSHGKGVAA